jgi:diketogulonate reductase-like aldo/keto reductase
VGEAWQLSKLPREEIFIATKLSDDRSCKRKKAKVG